MAKKVVAIVKLALDAGKATPAPPVGPALGQRGVNIVMFCKEYNAKTADKIGFIIPVEITVYDDRSYTFLLKTPPASVLCPWTTIHPCVLRVACLRVACCVLRVCVVAISSLRVVFACMSARNNVLCLL